MVTASLANTCGITPSTIYSIFDPKRRDISLTTVKKICDGLEITLGEFFSHPLFDTLEQEIF
ncbi:helix-turn-helix transcriptional regulator [Clostridium sp. AN503]|uniref:helix-turn-helix domain-containing protein n=1 Tax=Clostridium sp. AN503 TaxID=3160598 RepID=UPI003459482D